MKPQYIKIDEKGSKFWYSDKKQTKLHREDGPAVEWADGLKEWYLNDKYHRKDGPAIDNARYEAWYINGKLHREYGPALKYKNDTCFWFVNGKEVTKQEHHAYFNPPKPKTININGKEFTVEELNSLIKTAEGNIV